MNTKDTLQITPSDESVVVIPKGATLEKAAEVYEQQTGSPLAYVAMANGRLRELSYVPEEDTSVRFLTIRDTDGMRAYMRSLYFLLVHATRELYGEEGKVVVRHGMRGSTYCEVTIHGRRGVSLAEAETIKTRMQELIEQDLPITKRRYPLDKVMDYFKVRGMMDKYRVFRYRRFSVINLYALGDSLDYFYGYMLPSTGRLRGFDLIPYENGVSLQLPSREDPTRPNAFKPSKKLFDVYMRSAEWSRILGVDSVGALNDTIAAGKIEELVQISEALHAGHIAKIAEEISLRRDTTKIVLIAGPSSSGKTTFAKKLEIQLKAEGLKPHMISVDDYFIDRDKTPLGTDGKPDFESLNAINTERFNNDLKQLLAGESVILPRYNFVTGKSEQHKTPLILGEGGILVIEGIHCLNEQLTAAIPRKEKFKIYISALTMINIDDHNRIPTTDGRLLRRMVRDNLYRGTSAAKTIEMWPSVRAGEEKNIFPYQEEADVMFNSAHIYELAVLKQYAEPLLFGIDPTEPSFTEARRLIKFLDYCLSVSSEVVPDTSIIREFIGGSAYNV